MPCGAVHVWRVFVCSGAGASNRRETHSRRGDGIRIQSARHRCVMEKSRICHGAVTEFSS